MNTEYWKTFIRNQFVPLAAILGVALLLAAFVGAWAALSIKSYDNTLSVTGSAKQEVQADSVRFTFSFSHTVPESGLAAGNQVIESDLAKVKAFLKENGVEDSEITIDPVMTNQVYDSNSSAPTRYMLTRTVKISSTRVDDIGKLAQVISSLTSQGVLIQANSPEYYYTKLADLRVSLLGDAIKDAKERANAIAKESGQHVGRLQSSTSGVVQVLAPNSIDVSDYGQYDTSSVAKEVMVTVRATFFVQ